MKKASINIKIIEDFLKENNLSKSGFCKQCNISVKTFNAILQRKEGVRLMAVLKIARIMEKELSDIFVEEV